MRNGPHVTPLGFAVIIGLAGFAFGSFGSDLVTAANVRDSPHVAPGTLTVAIGLTSLAFLCLSACKSR